jgi:hypothetical protein
MPFYLKLVAKSSCKYPISIWWFHKKGRFACGDQWREEAKFEGVQRSKMRKTKPTNAESLNKKETWWKSKIL